MSLPRETQTLKTNKQSLGFKGDPFPPRWTIVERHFAVRPTFATLSPVKKLIFPNFPRNSHVNRNGVNLYAGGNYVSVFSRLNSNPTEKPYRFTLATLNAP